MGYNALGGATNAPEAILGLKLVYAFLPAAIFIIAPRTERRQANDRVPAE